MRYKIWLPVILIVMTAFAMMSYSARKTNHIKVTALKTKDAPKPTCTCATPSFTSVVTTGGTTMFHWTAIAPNPPSTMTYYSFGGYYSNHSGFSYCTANTWIEIPYNGGGTVQVRAICTGTCGSATCSSTPSGPRNF